VYTARLNLCMLFATLSFLRFRLSFLPAQGRALLTKALLSACAHRNPNNVWPPPDRSPYLPNPLELCEICKKSAAGYAGGLCVFADGTLTKPFHPSNFLIRGLNTPHLGHRRYVERHGGDVMKPDYAPGFSFTLFPDFFPPLFSTRTLRTGVE